VGLGGPPKVNACDYCPRRTPNSAAAGVAEEVGGNRAGYSRDARVAAALQFAPAMLAGAVT
jgi:hypothetical protein